MKEIGEKLKNTREEIGISIDGLQGFSIEALNTYFKLKRSFGCFF